MNMTQRSKLEKLVKSRIERAIPVYQRKREDAHEVAKKQLETALGLDKLNKKLKAAQRKVAVIRSEIEASGYKEDYNWVDGKAEYFFVVKDHADAVNSVVDEMVKPVDFKQLEEDLMVKIYLSGEVDEVMDILSQIELI